MASRWQTRFGAVAALTVALTTTGGLPGRAFAQEQPARAENRQDEVVNIVLGPDQGAEDVLRILRSDDKAETNEFISRVFELYHTEAYEMVFFIRQAVSSERGFVRAAATKPTDGSAPRYFLLVTTTPEQMPYIEESIRKLDVHGFVNRQGRTRQAFRLKYRRASELADVLANTRLTSLGRVFADDLSNTLYLDESAYVVGAIQRYIKFYDVPTPQVEFDVRIIEIAEENAGPIGLDWDAWKQAIGGQFTFSSNSFEGGDNFARLDTLLTLDARVLADFLNYTVQQGHADLLKRSRLNASNLRPAVIAETRRVPFIDFNRLERKPEVLTESNPAVDAAGEDGAAGPRTLAVVAPTTFERADLGEDEEGIVIAIQPVIGVDMVSAAIDLTIKSFNGFDALDRPIVAEQHLTNQFTLEDGQTILLGTLERRELTEARRGIPGLKDLPGLRSIFGVREFREKRSRLFILATPSYNNLTYGARDLTEVDTLAPVLNKKDAPVLDDGQLDYHPELARFGKVSDAAK